MLKLSKLWNSVFFGTSPPGNGGDAPGGGSDRAAGCIWNDLAEGRAGRIPTLPNRVAAKP